MNENDVKILLVEDNPGDARLISEMVKRFEKIHPELENKKTLQEVLQMDESSRMDIILLDLSLPDASGVELLRQVRHRFPGIPIIIITGLNDMEMVKQTVGEGVQDYLVKANIDQALLEHAIQYSIWRNKYNTQHLEMEAALREKQKLEKINEKLYHTLRLLEKSNGRLKEFAYVATHNLRTFTVNLAGLIDLYDETGKNEKVFENIRLTANNLNLFLNDLIGLVILDKPVLDKKNISFADIIKTVRSKIEPQLKSSKAEITTDLKLAESIIYSYSHLHNILLNLLTNALKFGKAGKNPAIAIKTFKSDGYICLSVTDNGIGIDLEKHRDKLFHAFKILHPDGEKRKGLGLYIVNTQVESLGGKVEVISKPGEGTTFNVYLVNDPDVTQANEINNETSQYDTSGLPEHINAKKNNEQARVFQMNSDTGQNK